MPIFNGTDLAETIDGSSGDDTILGRGGNDSINGLSGADRIDGGDGADRVNAGEGDDTVTAGRSDTISGGGGDDLITFAGQDTTGSATSINGDAGIDTLVLDFSTAFDSLTSSNSFGGSGSMAAISYSGIERLSISGGTASDILVAGEGDDTLIGNRGNDRLDAKAGINVLVGGAGRDVGLVDLTSMTDKLVVIWTGADTIIGGNSFSGIEGLGLKGGSGNDYVDVRGALASSEIYGGVGGERIYSDNAWADTIDGGADDDLLVFGRRDNVHGGLGNDVFTFAEEDPTNASTNVFGDDGIDTLILDFSTAFDAVKSTSATSIAGINFQGFDQLVFTGGSASDVLIGGAGNDTLTGNGGNDRLVGGGGPNKLDGGSGRDIGTIDLSGDIGSGITVNFKAGKGTIAGTKFIQIESLGLSAGSGNDWISVAKAQGSSELFGNAGADTLTGSAAWADILSGGDGNDLINFDPGDTSVRGGNGDDVLHIGGVPNPNRPVSVDGEAGLDTLVVDFSAATQAFSSTNSFNGSGNIAGVGFSNIEWIELTGGAGKDSLVGGQGSDTIIGGDGADTISGLSDTDLITGGDGADKLSGGLGVLGDVFYYRALTDSTIDISERDTITDFTDVDRIHLAAIDADTSTLEDDAFTFISSGAFTGVAGELRFQSDGVTTTIYGDVNGDAVADFAIDLTGSITLVEGEFVL